MTTRTQTRTTTDAGTPRSHPGRIYLTEARHEFLKLIRIPIFAVSTIALPVIFYVLFGVAFAGGQDGGAGVTTYLLATYGTFGVIGAALFGFGVSVALERGQGWMRLKRVSPMPPQAYFVAKVAMSTTVSALIIGALFVLGATLGGVRLSATGWISLGLVLLLGALPFSAMGLAFGYLVGPNSAPAMLNLIYLPMAFASGLWIPIHQLPAFVQGIAPALPPYHFAQLALGTVGAAESGSWALHAVVLLAFTAFFLAVAAWGFRRDEGRTYG
ncbi:MULTISPECIES: ABC transporter permease [unclassified Ornithinimicrobium]|uniref:ABC transporter permease n=1 Tax=unclassified Ornithinimicrobium TaxID=2615080 RepID=UPI0038541BC7